MIITLIMFAVPQTVSIVVIIVSVFYGLKRDNNVKRENNEINYCYQRQCLETCYASSLALCMFVAFLFLVYSMKDAID